MGPFPAHHSTREWWWAQGAIALRPLEPDACRRVVVFVLSSSVSPTKSLPGAAAQLKNSIPNCVSTSTTAYRIPSSAALILCPKAAAASRHLDARPRDPDRPSEGGELAVSVSGCAVRRAAVLLVSLSRSEGWRERGSSRFLAGLSGCGSKARRFPLHLPTAESNLSTPFDGP